MQRKYPINEIINLAEAIKSIIEAQNIISLTLNLIL
jgi:hypothetical protein